MIFKSEDSMSYYCPYIRGMDEPFCEGSDCAAWRWVYDPSDPTYRDDTYGYCGLAGKPKYDE